MTIFNQLDDCLTKKLIYSSITTSASVITTYCRTHLALNTEVIRRKNFLGYVCDRRNGFLSSTPLATLELAAVVTHWKQSQDLSGADGQSLMSTSHQFPGLSFLFVSFSSSSDEKEALGWRGVGQRIK